MRKILGLVGSQRKTANGEIMLKEAASAAGEDCQLELIRLAEWRFKVCKGCFACLGRSGSCPLDDDLYPLIERIKAADGIILAAPCYALGPAAITKLIGDRILVLNQYLDDFWGKPCVIIGTAGTQGWEGYTLSALINQVRLMGFALKDACMFIGGLPGEALLPEKAKERARLLGSRLFGAARSSVKGECPNCWSDIWKFPQPDTALCPLCGQTAKLAVEGGVLRWSFGSQSERLGKEMIRHHSEELKGRVKEYLLRRNELEVVRKAYKGEDNWVKPEKSATR